MWAARQSNVELLLDVGLTVGTEQQFTASFTLTPRELAIVADAQVHLKVSAYPAPEEPNN
jgi:hypothetical protein